jgi:hypothetical protein
MHSDRPRQGKFWTAAERGQPSEPKDASPAKDRADGGPGPRITGVTRLPVLISC